MMQCTETKNRIALIGGTFDPVHIGHVRLFHSVYEYGHFDTLIVIPALISNFKQGTSPASFSSRVEMLELAIEDYHELFPDDKLRLEISRFEGERGGVSYTSETIKAFFDLVEEEGKVNFIIGDDILPKLNQWHDFEYIKRSVRFYCFSRFGESVDYGAEVHFIPSPVTEASSTSVRMGDVNMLTKRVRKYIDDNQLYRAL